MRTLEKYTIYSYVRMALNAVYEESEVNKYVYMMFNTPIIPLLVVRISLYCVKKPILK